MADESKKPVEMDKPIHLLGGKTYGLGHAHNHQKISPRHQGEFIKHSAWANLTDRQRRFCKAFNGNILESMKIAGYRGNDRQLVVMGRALMRNEKISTAIQSRREVFDDPSIQVQIASRQEIQIELTDIMYDKVGQRTADRLKAMELLGRSMAMYVDKLEVKSKTDLATLVAKSMEEEMKSVEEEAELVDMNDATAALAIIDAKKVK